MPYGTVKRLILLFCRLTHTQYEDSMLHKSILTFTAHIFVLTTLLFFSAFPAQGPSKPPAGQFPMDMSEDEIKMFTEFIESLDQETLDALNAIGEEIIKEADELGIDPFDYIQLQAQAQQEFEEKSAKDKSEKAKPSQPVTQQTTAEAQTAQELFKGIAKVIPEIIQKAASDINLSNDILPFKYRLDDLVYYCTRLADEKMLKYLSDPTFKELIESARTLYKALTTLNDQFIVSEFNLEGENPYEILGIAQSASQDDIVAAYDKLLKIIDPDTLELQLIKNGKSDDEIKKEVQSAHKRLESVNNAYEVLRSKEEASFLLNKILDAVSEAVDSKKLLEQAAKLMQLHEPEALKLKKEQEKIEAEARKAQDSFIKKRALTSRSFAMPMPKQKGGKKYGGDRGSRDGYSPTKTGKKKDTIKPTKVSTSSDKKGGGSKPSGKKPDDKKDGDKKKKKAAAKPNAKGKPSDKAKLDGKKPDDKKDGDKKDGDKKPLISAVNVAIDVLKERFDEIRRKIKKNKTIKETPITTYVTTAENLDKGQAYLDFMNELSTEFAGLETSLSRQLKKFEKKDEELKQFKSEAEKLFKKFEESDQYKKIALLFSKNFKKDQPIVIGTVTTNLNADKAKLLFESAKKSEKDEDGEAPKTYLEVLRNTYKKAKDKVASKKEDKKPNVPLGTGPFIG